MTITTGAAPTPVTTEPGPASAAPARTAPEVPASSEPAPSPPLRDRLRAALPVTGPGLTSLGATVLGVLVVGLGTVGDLALGPHLGLGFAIVFVVACVLVALTVRVRALGTAVVLPPILFAAAQVLASRGQTAGTRELALDVATSLALAAPVLFLGTAAAASIALVRVVVHLVRR